MSNAGKPYQLFVVKNLLGVVIHIGAFYIGKNPNQARRLCISHIKPPFVVEDLEVIDGSNKTKEIYNLKKKHDLHHISQFGNRKDGYRYKNKGGSDVYRVKATFAEE